MPAVQIITGTMDTFGGYRVNGVEFLGEECEALVDEAREMACSTGRQVEACLASILPQDRSPAPLLRDMALSDVHDNLLVDIDHTRNFDAYVVDGPTRDGSDGTCHVIYSEEDGQGAVYVTSGHGSGPHWIHASSAAEVFAKYLADDMP